MRKNSTIIGILFGLYLSVGSFSQETEQIVFPSNESGYLATLQEYLQPLPDRTSKEVTETLNEWKSNYQPEENEWIELAKTSNDLVTNGIIPIQFIDFLNACFSFQKNKLDRQSFINWLTYMRRQMVQEPGQLSQAVYIWEFLQRFNLRDELYASGTVKWMLDTSIPLLESDTSLYLSFSQGELNGQAGTESTTLYCDSGKFYPMENLLTIRSGEASWESVDLPKDVVYASFQSANLDLSKTVYSIDSVLFYDIRHFNDPIYGFLENKIATGLPKERRGYPKFTSYTTDNQIKNLYPKMDYRGGYSLQGQRIIGANTSHNQGYLTIFFQGDPQVLIGSDYFVFTPDIARGINAEVSIYLDQDSIYHPGLSFQYKQNTNEIVLIRDGQGLSNSRFFDTYHAFDLDVDMISWIASENKMKMSGLFGSLQNRADFESADFYSIDRFNQIQVADLVNPIILIKSCAEHYHSRFFTTGDLSAFMNKPFHLVEELILNISFLGFVRYDEDRKLIEVTQRAFDFIAKHAERQDYDMIRFRSNQMPPQPNGFLDLKSKELELFGVEQINLSTTRNVTIFPKNQALLIGKNRHMQFDGYVQSGLAGFSGSGFSLRYDEFTLEMGNIDQISLQVHLPVNNSYEESIVYPISSVIENTAGSLHIDAPTNKSGILAEELTNYPMFIADTTAFVYYDDPSIQNGQYGRDQFYFQSNDLQINSLNSKYLKDSLQFNGQFVTAGIFPEINVTLGYQEDQSLGFDTLFTPESGYPVYGGKGVFYHQINMNSNGLLGKGRLEYLGASMESDQFLFLPNEVLGRETQLLVSKNMAERGSPAASGTDVAVSWLPEANQVTAKQSNGELNLYKGVDFAGEFFIEPDGIKGNGTLIYADFEVVSKDFHFFEDSFEADSSHFYLFSQMQTRGEESDQIRMNDLQVMHATTFVDFSDSLVSLSSIDKASIAFFPENKFKAEFERMDWKMGSNQAYLAQLRLISDLPQQLGLSYPAESAIFDRTAYTITSEGTSYIDIADVKIYPGSGKTTIRKNAFIDSLTQSIIVPKDSSFNHSLNQATVNLISQTNYTAKGQYIFTDRAGREFVISMNKVTVNNDHTTVANGQIAATENFFLSPEYAYQGAVQLMMNQKELLFDGHYQLTHDCSDLTKKWVRMQTDIDPLQIHIPFDSLTSDINNEKVYAGFFLSNQPIEFYSTFLGPHTRYSDHPVLPVDGFVHYDDDSGDYRICSLQKLNNREAIYPEISFDRKNCVVEAEGALSLGIDLGQITMNSAGRINHDLSKDSISLMTITSLDYFMNDKAMSYMAKELNQYAEAQPVNYGDSQFRRALQFFIDSARAQEILNEISLRGGFRRLPPEFDHSIQFAPLHLTWNPEKGAFVSTGKIGITNIGMTPVNKLFNGAVEITHRRGGGSLTIYLETDPGSYFYFYYNRGLMQVLAGPKYEKFNEFVRETKESKRKSVSASGTTYQYYIGQYRLVRNFLNQLEEE